MFLGGLLVLLVVYYWFLHRKPFTQNAFLVANTRPVSPLVAGYLTEVHVRNHQFVKKGQKLISIYRPPYELQVKALEAELAGARANSDALEAAARGMAAQLASYEAQLANRRFLAKQAEVLYQTRSVSETYTVGAVKGEESAAADRLHAGHALAAAQAQKRVSDSKVRKLEHQLAQAKISLAQTTVYALADGYVNNMLVAPGGYYEPGDVLFSFVETAQWYVQANFEETELALIAPGQKAKIWLWQYPGRTFHGEVIGTALGAERRQSSSSGVQVVAKENQWFMLPQRLPVQIRVLDPDPKCPFNLGASAFVQIETPSKLLQQLVWRVFRW